MFNRTFLHENSYLLQWLWKHGWEEPVGPLGPFTRQFLPISETLRQGPSPEPWREAVPQLVEAIQAKDLAMRLDGPLKEEATKRAAQAINSILDDWCGTPPRKWPWPWPGPPPWTWEIASELSLVANSLQPGSLKDGLLDLAVRVVKHAGGIRQ